VKSLLAADNMGAGLFLYVPMFIYSWFFDAWLPLTRQITLGMMLWWAASMEAFRRGSGGGSFRLE
jgi:hypothetical protein